MSDNGGQQAVTCDVLTDQEAAEYLKVSQRTLLTLRQKGIIRAARVGRQLRYLLADLQAYLRRAVAQ